MTPACMKFENNRGMNNTNNGNNKKKKWHQKCVMKEKQKNDERVST